MIKNIFFVALFCASTVFAPRAFVPHVPPCDHGASPVIRSESLAQRPIPVTPTTTAQRQTAIMACGIFVAAAFVFNFVKSKNA